MFKKTFAKRLTVRIVILLFIIIGGMAHMLFLMTSLLVTQIYSGSYHMSMLNSTEYARRVLSDVYVAVVNSVDEVEENLDTPENIQGIMRRIVANNKRIQNCGTNFIEDYYPRKGHYFVPYARKDRKSNEITTATLTQFTHNDEYSSWLHKGLTAKDGFWSEPFFSNDSLSEPVVAYSHPVHDKTGRTVAIIGADISLEWLTKKLNENDQEVNRKHSFVSDSHDDGSVVKTYIINKEGTFITHPDSKLILKDNLFDHLKDGTTDSIQSLRESIAKGVESKTESGFTLLYDDEESYFFYCPLKYTDWTVISVIPVSDIDVIGYAVGALLIILITITLLIVFALCYITIRHSTKPLQQLAESAEEVAKGNFNTPLPTIKHKDEIRQLRDSFENMQLSLTQYIEELKLTTASKASIENELRIAHNIQMAMLPKTFPPFPDRHDIDIFALLKPAKAVGGDLFDFFISDEKLFFCIGDVSGKGVPASLVMAVTRTLFRNLAAHQPEPQQIVNGINRSVCDGNDTNMFVTLFIGVLDLKSGHMTYCNAGHDAPYLIGNDVSQLPVESNLPVGILPDWEYSLQQTVIEPGTTIFLYTDGLNEATNEAEELFGDERIVSEARTILAQDKAQPKDFIHLMNEAVQRFVDKAEQSDDLTMLAIKRNKHQD